MMPKREAEFSEELKAALVEARQEITRLKGEIVSLRHIAEVAEAKMEQTQAKPARKAGRSFKAMAGGGA
jgi:hypothetical protein